MRSKYTLLNVTAGVGSQILITSLSFLSRTVFIYTLGVEYLGINGLFTSLLLMLSIAEAGIGSAIMYSLYKPVADQDEDKMLVLMKLYRKIYRVIAAVVLVLGLLLMPALPFLTKGVEVEHLHGIFLLFLLNTSLPYLFQHKSSFLHVCQKGYIVTAVYTIATLLSTVMKVGVLYWTKNYLLFLTVEFVINMISAMVLASIVDRMYPILKSNVQGHLDRETKQNIVKNVKAIVLQRIGNYVVTGADNLIISTFISVAAVGIYSNYVMLIEICRNLINQVFNNMYHSIGNLIAKESREKIFSVFKATLLVNFWLYSLLSIGLLLLLEPFIRLWIGNDYILPSSMLGLLVALFYERGMRNSITTVKTTSGIFHEDRYVPLCQAVLNIVLSLLLVQVYGMSGIFVGTLISTLLTLFWVTPWLVYRKVFKQGIFHYVKSYVGYTMLAFVTYMLLHYTLRYIPETGFGWLALKGGLIFIAINAIYTAVFFRTSEFQYLLSLAHVLTSKIRVKVGLINKIDG